MELPTTRIPLNKRKLIKGLLISLVFVLLGTWLCIYRPVMDNAILDGPFVKSAIGIAALLFFGLGSFYYGWKLSDRRMGLIIDNEGITDNSSAVAAGFIPWEDVLHLASTRIMQQEFLLVLVKNPETYIDRQKSRIKKSGMRMNFKSYGSPITISSTALKCNFDELKSMLAAALTSYKSNNP